MTFDDDGEGVVKGWNSDEVVMHVPKGEGFGGEVQIPSPVKDKRDRIRQALPAEINNLTDCKNRRRPRTESG